MIGRAGTAYFDKADSLAAENKKRALERLAIEEKLVPDIPLFNALARSGVGRQPTPEQVRTVYTSARNEAAQVAKEHKFNSAAERMAWIEQEANKATENYLDQFSTQPIGPRGRSTAVGSEITPGTSPALASAEESTQPIPVTPPSAPAQATGQIIPKPRNRAEEAREKNFLLVAKKPILTNIRIRFFLQQR
ncbi:MAG: hypothetical protein HC777_02755 [Hyphomonadaceae bacterium]|nr:hypothetical protein [Hyphomonadaceae bacterium]